MISNVIGDCEKIRSLLTAKQIELNGRAKAVASHCPTRFGTLVFILRDVISIKEALRHTVISDAWPDVCGGSKHAAEFAEVVIGRRSVFWQLAVMVLELMAPIMDAIHQIEADRAMLSQMLMMWETLVIHAEKFCADASHASLLVPGQDGDGLMSVLGKRMQKAYHKSFPAAFYLDPIHFQDKEGRWSSPDSVLLSTRQRDDAIEVICRLVGATSRCKGGCGD
jgi:hypothetical protein